MSDLSSVPCSLGAASSIATVIPRIHVPSITHFQSSYFLPRVPVILSGVLAGWLAMAEDLNGPEISKFIKKECSTNALAAAGAISPITDDAKASHSVLSRWLKQLHHSLLHSGDWTPPDIDAWRSAVNDIHQHWQAETSQAAFPKLHMLHHTIDFAERHRFLGRASEAQIESFHATFNALFHKQHRNQSSNTSERLRRSLADTSLRAVQPFVIE